MASQVDCEVMTLPTGARVFSRGGAADAIHAVRRGIVEVIGERSERLCYRPGELFSYQDILWREDLYRTEAVARTPVEVVRLDRLRFLNLLHNHPTLAILLIDVLVFARRPHEPSRRECVVALSVYVGLAVLFGLWVRVARGLELFGRSAVQSLPGLTAERSRCAQSAAPLMRSADTQGP
jgi:hypothetical protein